MYFVVTGTRDDFREDGYFITGDLGMFDVRGYVHIVGRGKDLVFSGGLNVYPKEVENEIDALSGGVESAVIGVPHADLGAGVMAAMLMQSRQRLAAFKVPRRIMFVAGLLRNAMGKVQKNVLRDRYADLYRLPVQQ